MSYQEVQGVKLKIKEADPRAFVVGDRMRTTPLAKGWKTAFLRRTRFIRSNHAMLDVKKS